MNVVNAAGDISSVTTTSGLAWKVPGRCGDSPIVGAGQYTDNSVGAAGSTGLGEANIMVCGGFLTVEHMRQGMSPTDAALATLKRVVALTPPSLLDERGRPTYQIQFYAVNKKGQYGAAAMTASPFAVCDEKGARIEQCATLYS
jgi:N4-(beta-N-acetylglucosaminyl)-L-asparaginase